MGRKIFFIIFIFCILLNSCKFISYQKNFDRLPGEGKLTIGTIYDFDYIKGDKEAEYNFEV